MRHPDKKVGSNVVTLGDLKHKPKARSKKQRYEVDELMGNC